MKCAEKYPQPIIFKLSSIGKKEIISILFCQNEGYVKRIIVSLMCSKCHEDITLLNKYTQFDGEFFLSNFCLQVITMPKFHDRCCYPHNLENHRKTLSLRNVPRNLASRYNLSTDDRICSSCYKKLLQHYAENLSDESDDNEPDERSENDENIVSGSIEVDNSGGNNLTGIFEAFMFRCSTIIVSSLYFLLVIFF